MTKSESGVLALFGGAPVGAAEWPKWPPVSDGLRAAALEALDGGRWAISGPRRAGPSLQERFENAWAQFNGLGHAVAVSSGSSALVLAMEALGLGPGDEVIVPVWTWVACASTVLRVGATPILIDVDPRNFCISADAVEAAITPRTRAVIGVHLHQSTLDIEPIVEVARAHGLYLIEDCAQAHGALYAGKRVGSFGDVACFSFQQTKPMTSGEGGAVVTDSAELAGRVFELHADSRRRSAPDPVTGLELAVGDGPMGGNHCMTEFQAALLLAQLPGFDEQIAHAAANAAWLDRELTGLGRLRALEHPPRLTRRTVYEYIISFEPEIVEDLPVSRIGEALTAETGTPWYPSDPPLHISGLYRPGSKRRFAAVAGDVPGADHFPVATDFARRSLVCHHSVLLAPRASMQSIVDAFAKVLARVDELRDAERG